jgi:hypothetical protein
MTPLGRACARASGANAAAETPATNSRRVNLFFGISFFGFQFTQVAALWGSQSWLQPVFSRRSSPRDMPVFRKRRSRRDRLSLV